MILNILILVFGLITLVKSAQFLVDKLALLSRRFQVPPFFVGVVLLGMGTSAPEAAVSAFSSMKGLSHLAIANVFGSNLFNILLVLGMVLVKPLPLKKIQNLKIDILFLVITGFALWPLMRDLFLSRYEALFLSLLFLVYMGLCFWNWRRDRALKDPKTPLFNQAVTSSQNLRFFKMPAVLALWLSLFIGFLFLILGSHFTVRGAEALGEALGISQRIMGLLIVSIGTSLPEFMAGLVALMKGHKDMALGNIIGSNVFNTFAILSLAVWIQPADLDTKMLVLDLPALMITHLLLLLLIFGYQKKWIQKIVPYTFLLGYFVFLLALFFYPYFIKL